MKYDIGLVGLAVMGENLVLNMERNGFRVAVFNRTVSKVDDFIGGRARGKAIKGCHSLDELIRSLAQPRKVMLMVKAGKAVDDFIELLIPYLEKGDIVIDGGNSYFPDSIRRTKYLEEQGLLFIGAGVSGGEEGALNGPSIMPGGSPAAWERVKPIFQKIAAQAPDGSPCCEWVGSDGAGHFVKMVHNGIEYGDMQMISEAYWILQQGLGLTTNQLQTIFQEWNRGELDSYLIQITAEIMGKADELTGQPLLDMILDAAGQKGTGRWTSQEALNLGVPAPTVVEAVMARAMSAVKAERLVAATQIQGPADRRSEDPASMIEKVRRALYASKICSYAQGFQLLRTAAREYHWDLHFGQLALLWRNGCIIRAHFLDKIKTAFDKKPDLANLLLDDYFKSVVESNQTAWREVVAFAVTNGLPVPAFSSALAYFDGYRSARLPANLLQALRDYFGAHTYERVDRPRGVFFHTDWTGHGGKTPSTTYNV